MAKKRELSFDILKCYTIFGVMWGHCIQYFTSGSFAADPVFRVIYSFHMPLFMMISGYFSWQSMDLPLGRFFEKSLCGSFPLVSLVAFFIY